MSSSFEQPSFTPTESLDLAVDKKEKRSAKKGWTTATAFAAAAGLALSGCSVKADQAPEPEQSQPQDQNAEKATPKSPLESPSNIPDLSEIQPYDGFDVEAFGNIDPGTSLEEVTELLAISKQETAKGNQELLGQKMANTLEYMYNGGNADANIYVGLYEDPENREAVMDSKAKETVGAVMDAFYGDDWEETSSEEVLDFADDITDVTRGGISDRFDSHIVNLETMELKHEDGSPRYDDHVVRTRINLVGVKRSMDGDTPTYNIVYNRKTEGISEDAALFNQEGFESNDSYHNPDYFTDKGRREGMKITFDPGQSEAQGHPIAQDIEFGPDERLAYPNQ